MYSRLGAAGVCVFQEFGPTAHVVWVVVAPRWTASWNKRSTSAKASPILAPCLTPKNENGYIYVDVRLCLLQTVIIGGPYFSTGNLYVCVHSIASFCGSLFFNGCRTFGCKPDIIREIDATAGG